MKKIILLSILFVFLAEARGQERVEEIEVDGSMMTALVVQGDTFFIAELDRVSVTSPREFETSEDYRRYIKYKRYAGIVYPYASEAIRVLANFEKETAGLKRGKKKKYARKKQRELNDNFKTPLKNLTKTQGRILTKMIERELDKSMHELLKELRGGLTAGYWQSTGKLFGYNLKEKYKEGDDPILDAVLQDFDISKDYKLK